MIRISALVLACVPLVTFALQSQEKAQEQALAGTTEAWEKAFNSGDFAAIARMMTSDACLLPPNGEKVCGAAAIEGFWKAASPTGAKMELREDEAETSGSLGFKTGTWRMLSAEGAELDHGKYVEVWKRVDGAWRLHRDTWNSSRPLPPAHR